MFFHIPTEGIANAIQGIINLWRKELETEKVDLFCDPAVARRDRIWRRALLVIVTLGFLSILALPVWLIIKASNMPPPTPEQILQRREMMSRRAGRTNASPTPDIQQSNAPVADTADTPAIPSRVE